MAGKCGEVPGVCGARLGRRGCGCRQARQWLGEEHCITAGLTTSVQPGIPASTAHYCAGRLEEQKGVDILLAAIKKLPKNARAQVRAALPIAWQQRCACCGHL